MQQEKLNAILEKHRKFLDNEAYGERADLRWADLRGADLRWADLRGANLYGADLRWANLYGADLRWARYLPYMACPSSGEYIAWKKANGLIVKLLIPEDALRSSATTNKCRANKATVLAIENTDGTPANVSAVASNYSPAFVYEIGETVEVKTFDCDRWHECASGIHHFIDRQAAVDWED